MATLNTRTTWSLMPHPPGTTPVKVFYALKKPRADYSVKTAKAETEGRKEDPKAGISSRISALAGSAGRFQRRDGSPSNRPAIGTEAKCWLVIGSCHGQGGRSPGGVGRG